jgi:hypothetical protein
MMIQSAAASDPVARATSPGSAARSPGGDASASTASPDVVVTLGQGASAPDTYNASGRFAAHPTLDDMGANAPDSLAKATESTGNDANADSSSATSDATSAAAPAADGSDLKAGQDAAVPA